VRGDVLDREAIASRLLPLFREGGRFHGRYQPPRNLAGDLEEVIPGEVLQAGVYPVGSATPDAVLRIYALDFGKSRELLEAHWRNEVRALLRISNRRHASLPVLHDANLLAEEGIGYLLLRNPGTSVVRSHPIATRLRTDLVRTLRDFAYLLEAVSLLHREGLIHRNITHHAVCALATEDAELTLDGFTMSAFVSTWLRGQGALSEEIARVFLPKENSSRVCLPKERLAPLFGRQVRDLEGFSTDVFSLGMIGVNWFCGPDDPESCDGVFADGQYHEAKHREVVEHARRRLATSKLPAKLVRLLTEMIAFEPANRPASGEEAYKSLGLVYGHLLSRFEAQAGGEKRTYTVFFLRESVERLYREQQRISAPPEDESSKRLCAELMEKDLLDGVLTWAPRGCEWLPGGEAAKITLLGREFAYFCQYLDENLPKKPTNTRALVVKHIVALSRVPELQSRTQHRALPDLRALFLQVGLPARPLDPDADWKPLVESIRPKAGDDHQRTLEKACAWLLRVQEAGIALMEYPYARLREEEGADPILRQNGDAGSGADDEDKAFVKLRQAVRRPVTLGDFAERVVEQNATNDRESVFVVRQRRFDGARLRFDGVLDQRTIRLKSAGDADVVPDEGFVHPDDRAERSLLGRQKEALRVVSRNYQLMRQLQDPQAIGLFGERDFADAGADVDKETRALIQRILRHWPFFLLQGPPGTGKTFVVAKVIREALRADPFARILVTAQSHHALDNLLEQTKDGICSEGLDRWVLLRVSSPHTTHKVGSIAAGFLEGNVLESLRNRMTERIPANGAMSGCPAAVAAIRRRWRDLAKNRQLDIDLVQRLRRSATLIFATCGTSTDQHLHTTSELGSFDWVVVEEAARAWLTEVVVPLRHGTRWLLVGDHKQLPAHEHKEILTLLDRDTNGRLTEPATGIEVSADFAPFLSYFASLMERTVPDEKGVRDRITIQRRMHPDIGNLVSTAFYEGELTNHASATKPHEITAQPFRAERALVWVDTSVYGPAAYQHGLMNPCEAKLLAFLVKRIGRFPQHDPRIPSVCVLSPYLEQVRILEEKLRNAPIPADSVKSVDAFQGRQAEVVFLSLVRYSDSPTTDLPHGLGFLAEPERVNVAFSRARRLLVIVGAFGHFKKYGDTFWGDVTRYVEAEGRFIVDPRKPPLAFDPSKAPPPPRTR